MRKKQMGITITLDDLEKRILVRGMMNYRNALQREGESTDDVEDVIMKIINASVERRMRDWGRDER